MMITADALPVKARKRRGLSVDNPPAFAYLPRARIDGALRAEKS
jgi:hypothetical protein